MIFYVEHEKLISLLAVQKLLHNSHYVTTQFKTKNSKQM